MSQNIEIEVANHVAKIWADYICTNAKKFCESVSITYKDGKGWYINWVERSGAKKRHGIEREAQICVVQSMPSKQQKLENSLEPEDKVEYGVGLTANELLEELAKILEAPMEEFDRYGVLAMGGKRQIHLFQTIHAKKPIWGKDNITEFMRLLVRPSLDQCIKNTREKIEHAALVSTIEREQATPESGKKRQAL